MIPVLNGCLFWKGAISKVCVNASAGLDQRTHNLLHERPVLTTQLPDVSGSSYNKLAHVGVIRKTRIQYEYYQSSVSELMPVAREGVVRVAVASVLLCHCEWQ